MMRVTRKLARVVEDNIRPTFFDREHRRGRRRLQSVAAGLMHRLGFRYPALPEGARPAHRPDAMRRPQQLRPSVHSRRGR